MRTSGSAVRTLLALTAALLALVAPALGQNIGDIKLVEAKQLAGSVFRALQQCVQGKGAGASCTLSEVASMAAVNPATGATPDGRWIAGPSSMLRLSSSAPSVATGAIGIVGATGRDTAGLALSLYVTPTGNAFRCETRSGVPPGPTGGQSC